ncbi:MAG: amidohydrolase [Galactobacter sp.]
MTSTANRENPNSIGTADVVFHGGPVFTGSGEPLTNAVVAVSGGRVTAVEHGTSAQAEGLLAGAKTTVDLQGKLLSPSFQDAHIHPLSGGLEMLQCDLTEAESAQEAYDTIATYAQSHPDEEWIVGGGWSMDHFPGGTPSRHDLDRLTGDRPAVLTNRDHHGSWANTAAMRAADVDATTPDPADGRIEREADGFPQGSFHEGAVNLFDAVRPAIHDDQALAGLLTAQERLIRHGVTGWTDALVGADLSGITDTERIYRRAIDEGSLKVHVRGSLWWDRTRVEDIEEQVAELTAKRDKALADGLAPAYDPSTIKIMVDGVVEDHTAAMLTPYHDHSGHATDNHGLTFVEAERLKRVVTLLDAAGFQCHFHALGDRAVRVALDAVEAAREANGPNENRHHLAHLQMVDEAEIPRFIELGATANLQALWAAHEPQLDELGLPFLREGAEERHYPFGDLVRAGVPLAAGSDWPISSEDPIQALHVAVNRRSPGSDLPILTGVEQCLDVATFLAAYTSGSARVAHRETDTGTLAEGYLANLVVLDPNPFAIGPEDLHTVTVDSTWIQGERVYSRADAGVLA